MNYEEVAKGDWVFKPIKNQRWQILFKGKHFAYVSTDAVLRALAAI